MKKQLFEGCNPGCANQKPQALTHKCVCICAISQVSSSMMMRMEKHRNESPVNFKNKSITLTLHMFFSCSLHVYIVNFGLVMRWRQGLKDGERSFLVGAWSFRERQLQLDWAISGSGRAWAEVVYTKASGVSLKHTWLAMSLSGTNDSFLGKAEWRRPEVPNHPDRTAVFLWRKASDASSSGKVRTCGQS